MALQKKPANITEIAKKQRYLYLLGKVRQSKQLSSSEIKELERYEMAKKGKTTKMPKKRKLTDKQLAFCREYLVDRNAKQAAIRAGYAPKSAEVTASKLLRNAKVQSKITELERPIAEKLEITAERVMTELANIAFFDPAELYETDGSLKDIHSIPVAVRRVISSLDVCEEFAGSGEDREMVGYIKKVRLNSKIKALELLGKTNTLDMFSENVKHTFPEGCGVLVAPVQMSKKDWAKQAKNNSKSTHGGKNAKNNSGNRTANSGSGSVSRG